MLSYLRYFAEWYLFRLIIVTAFLGGGGAILIAYELLADRLGLRSPSLDNLASFLGTTLTLVGVFITTGSIFIYSQNPTKPDPGSFPVAIVVMGVCATALYVLFTGGKVPDNLVNGVAMLGLAGGLARIQPNPQKSAREF
jgi:hypothetical protein